MSSDIGIATAYGYALSKGYTGTEEEFAEQMARLTNAAAEAAASAGEAAESAQAATDAAREAAESESDAEAWAVGERDGEDVPQSDPTYHNNAKYYADSAGETVSAFTEATAPAAVQAVNTAGQTQIGAVNTAGQTQVGAVNTAGQTALTAVGEARTAAVNAVQQKGEDVLEELQDYADLPEDVDNLKSAFTQLASNLGTISNSYFEPAYYTNAVVGQPLTWTEITSSTYTRLSTPVSYALKADVAYKVIIPSGYKLIAFKLDNNNNFVELLGWYETDTVLESGFNYVFTFAEAHDNNITHEDLDGLYIVSSDIIYAQDAHMAGDNVNILGACRWLHGNVKNNPSTNITYIDYTILYRLTTIDYFAPSCDVKLSVDAGYRYYLFEIANDGTTAGASGWKTAETLIQSGKRYRLILSEKNDGAIDIIDYRHLHAEPLAPFETKLISAVEKALVDKDSNTFTFALITDTHNDDDNARRTAKQGEMIGYIADRVGANFAIHLGDVSQGVNSTLAVNKQTIAEFWEKMHTQHTPILYTIAHHEMYGAQGAAGWGNDPTAPSASDCIGMYGKATAKWLDVHYSNDGLSWYCDIGDVRCIGLDSASDGPYGFSNDVVSFLENSLNTTNKIVLFSHAAPYGNVMQNDDAPTNGSAIQAKLAAHTGSEILAFFHGHTHWDNYAADGNGIMYISTCCALPEKVSSSLYCSAGTPTAYDRTIGDYSEFCMDIVNIHPNTGIVKTFRVGAGSDRTISLS